jgi:hypothetical protein
LQDYQEALGSLRTKPNQLMVTAIEDTERATRAAGAPLLLKLVDGGLRGSRALRLPLSHFAISSSSSSPAKWAAASLRQLPGRMTPSMRLGMGARSITHVVAGVPHLSDSPTTQQVTFGVGRSLLLDQ